MPPMSTVHSASGRFRSGTWQLFVGLWATQWLTDVEGVARAAIVTQLFVMAVMQSLGAFLIGISTDRLTRRGIRPQALVVLGAGTLIVAQVLLILRVPIPSYVVWSTVAIVGATTVLGFVTLAEYFPKEVVAGRANAALGIFHIGGAFVIQYVIGVIIQAWANQNGHYPAIVYQTAFVFNVGLQIVALIWFIAPRSPRVATHFKLATA